MDSLHVTLVAATLITVAVLYLAVTSGQSTTKIGWPDRILLGFVAALMAGFWIGVGAKAQERHEPVSYTAELPVVRAALPCPGRLVLRDLTRLRRGRPLDKPQFRHLRRAVRAEESPASKMLCNPRETQARQTITKLLQKPAS